MHDPSPGLTLPLRISCLTGEPTLPGGKCPRADTQSLRQELRPSPEWIWRARGPPSSELASDSGPGALQRGTARGTKEAVLSLAGWEEKMGGTAQTSPLSRPPLPPSFLAEELSLPQCQILGAPNHTEPERAGIQKWQNSGTCQPVPSRACDHVRAVATYEEGSGEQKQSRRRGSPVMAGLRCYLLQEALLEAVCGAPALWSSPPFSPSTVSSLGSSAIPPNGWPW